MTLLGLAPVGFLLLAAWDPCAASPRGDPAPAATVAHAPPLEGALLGATPDSPTILADGRRPGRGLDGPSGLRDRISRHQDAKLRSPTRRWGNPRTVQAEPGLPAVRRMTQGEPL